MRFDHSITLVNGAAPTADPVTAPLTVPVGYTFRLPRRSPESGDESTSMMLTLDGLIAETVDLEVYVLNDADDDPTTELTPAATDRWVKVATVSGLAGGDSAVVGPVFGGGRRSVGGLFYVRMTAETIGANRDLWVALRPGGASSNAYGTPADVNLAQVGGTATAQQGGRQKIVTTLRLLTGPVTAFDDGGGPPIGPEALTVNFADSTGTDWVELPADCQVIRYKLTTSGTAPTALEVMPRQSNDGGVADDVGFECDNDIVDGDLQTSDLYVSVHDQDGGATLPNGTYVYSILRDELFADSTHVKIQARRLGGDATSALQATVQFEG